MKDLPNNTGHLQGHTKKPLLKAIREKCLDCCGHYPSEVRKCHITDCPLWPYRMRKNPFHTRKITGKQKQAATQRLKNQTNKNQPNSRK